MEKITWDRTKHRQITTPKEMEDFFNDIDDICKKYNMSIAHEDCHGAFIIERYSEKNIEWLKNAFKNYE